MAFLLTSDYVGNYLTKKGFCSESEQTIIQVDQIKAKNFNLLVNLPNKRHLIVKQERHNQQGKAAGEFWGEWRIQQLLEQFPALHHLRPFLPEVLHFDAENSIIVCAYLDDYHDLIELYRKENIFAPEIAVTIGTLLAAIHRNTFKRQDYQDFFEQNPVRIPGAKGHGQLGPRRSAEGVRALRPADCARHPRGHGRVAPAGARRARVRRRARALRRAAPGSRGARDGARGQGRGARLRASGGLGHRGRAGARGRRAARALACGGVCAPAR